MEHHANVVMHSLKQQPTLARLVALFLEQHVRLPTQLIGNALVDMVSPLLGVGAELAPIGRVLLVGLSLEAHVPFPKRVLCIIHVLLGELSLDLPVLSRSPRISHTVVLKAVLSLEHNVSCQTANV